MINGEGCRDNNLNKYSPFVVADWFYSRLRIAIICSNYNINVIMWCHLHVPFAICPMVMGWVDYDCNIRLFLKSKLKLAIIYIPGMCNDNLYPHGTQSELTSFRIQHGDLLYKQDMILHCNLPTAIVDWHHSTSIFLVIKRSIRNKCWMKVNTHDGILILYTDTFTLENPNMSVGYLRTTHIIN